MLPFVLLFLPGSIEITSQQPIEPEEPKYCQQL